MIRTKTELPYDLVNLTKVAKIYARVIQAIRNDIHKTYTLQIEEWVELPYTTQVPEGENGELIEKIFYEKKQVRTVTRSMSFAEADQLTNALDQMFEITETGTARRKKYTILGHLVINNNEQVRNVEWELVTE